jgi:hypothetical protein
MEAEPSSVSAESVSDDVAVTTPRRTFIGRLGAFASGAALSILGCAPGSDGPTSPSPGARRVSRSVLLSSPSTQSYQYVGQSLDLPTHSISFLPSDYVHWGSYLRRPDGFGGGEEEVSYWYRSVTAQNSGRNALSVYATRWPTKPFGGTHDRTPSIVPVVMVTGDAVDAEYFDGAWRFDDRVPTPSHGPYPMWWDTANVHCLTARVRGVSIGVRGRRRAGIGLTELRKVLAGISFEFGAA